MVVDDELRFGVVLSVYHFLVVVHDDGIAAVAAVLHGALVGHGKAFIAGEDGVAVHESVRAVHERHFLPEEFRPADGRGIFSTFSCVHVLYGESLRRLDGKGVRGLIHQTVVGEVRRRAREGAAVDDALVAKVQEIPRFEGAVFDTLFVDEREVIGFERGRRRDCISEEGNLRVACRVGDDGAGDFHAQGGGFVRALHFRNVFDGDIFPFDVHEGVRIFFIPLFSNEAVISFSARQVDDHIAFGSVDGIHDEIAVGFLEVHAVFCAGGEDAAALDGDISERPFAGFEDDFLPGCRVDGEALNISGAFDAEVFPRGEAAAAAKVPLGDEVDGALAGEGVQGRGSLGVNGTHRGQSDRISCDMEVTLLGAGEGEELLFRQLGGVAEIDGHALFLLADVAAGGGEADAGPRHVRRAFAVRIRVGDAFLDAAGGEGDEKILRGFRGAHQNFRLLAPGEEAVALEVCRGDGGFAVNGAVVTVDGFHVAGHVRSGPSAHGVLQRIIARLLRSDVSVHVDALAFDDGAGAVV